VQYTKTVIPAGHTLKLLAVFEDVSGSQSSALSNKRLSFPLIGRSHNNTRYAQCLNNKNQVRHLKGLVTMCITIGDGRPLQIEEFLQHRIVIQVG
jgi:hypothetical protein